MSRTGIEQLVYMMDQAFEGDTSCQEEQPSCSAQSWHALLVNLRAVAHEDWTWVPEHGQRSILNLVKHVGECKYMYDNHAFGDGSMSWDKPRSVRTIDGGTPPEQVFEWLREGHRRLRQHVSALEDDAELIKPRRSNWGREYETRWLIKTMIEHDLYHAGEINHIRALLQENDEP